MYCGQNSEHVFVVMRRHHMQNNMIDGSLKNRFDDEMAINGVLLRSNT